MMVSGLNYLPLLYMASYQKGSNAAMLYGQYLQSRLLKKPVLGAMPIALGVEPTTSCNLRCPQCPSGLRSFSRNTGNMSMQVYNRIIDEMHPYIFYLTLYFQGEPFLHKHLIEMIRVAAQKNIFVSTSTNGHYLTPDMCAQIIQSGLSRIIISLDGAEDSTYTKYRIGGQYEIVIEGIKQLVQKKRQLKNNRLLIELQFIVFKHNQHEIGRIRRLAKTLGADICTIKSAQVYNFETDTTWIPDIPEKSRYYKTEEGNYRIKNRHLNHCWRMWHAAVITWDGNVVPCCFDKDASHVMGNLASQTFREIWFGEKYFAFRRQLFQSRKTIDICTNCSEGL